MFPTDCLAAATVAHPSWLMKVITWFLQVFISPKFFNKVVSHDDLATMEMEVPWDELQLPDWVRFFLFFSLLRGCSSLAFISVEHVADI